MAEGHRKIELESPEDLRYLINNAKMSASEKIDRAFPPMANQGEDMMKIRVQELVDEVSSLVTRFSLVRVHHMSAGEEKRKKIDERDSN